MYKISVVIPVYNSHEAFRRQLLYWSKLDLPKNIEFVIVDDGSEPKLTGRLKNFTILHTNDTRPWTQGIARNWGAREAQGEYLFFTDIDHILSIEAINDVFNFTGDKMMFPRYLAVLLEDGTLTQDIDTLIEYGLDPERMKTRRGLYASYHGNTYAIKKSTFDLLGGYDEDHCLYGKHAPRRQGEDSVFNARWNHYARANNIQPVVGSKIYMFTNGRYHVLGDQNPKGLFHNLEYDD